MTQHPSNVQPLHDNASCTGRSLWEQGWHSQELAAVDEYLRELQSDDATFNTTYVDDVTESRLQSQVIDMALDFHSCTSSDSGDVSCTVYPTSYDHHTYIGEWFESDDNEEKYAVSRIHMILEKCRADSTVKPTISYIALISLAIQSSPEQKMLLSEIYTWSQENIAYFRLHDKSWRNSIRHNLSLNECFVKARRCDSGKGHYWTIHPACLYTFQCGDFRRRNARSLVKKYEQNPQSGELIESGHSSNVSGEFTQIPENCYVPMASTQASGYALAEMFGPEVVLTKDEMIEAGYL